MAIEAGNESVFELLLAEGVDLEVKTSDGLPPLFYALRKQESRNLSQTGFPAKLVEKGASTNTVRRQPLLITYVIVFSLSRETFFLCH